MYNLEVDIQSMKRLQDRLAPAPEEVPRGVVCVTPTKMSVGAAAPDHFHDQLIDLFLQPHHEDG